jgi:hypothetical protein
MTDVRSSTGLALGSLDDAQDYYEARAVKLKGAPPFSPAVLPFLRYLDNARDGEAWTDLVARLASEREHATRGGSLLMAVYPEDVESRHRGFDVEPEQEDVTDEMLAEAAPEWAEINHDPVVGEVFGALIDLAPLWARLSLTHEPATAEWHWSRVRMICGSAGYNNHAQLTERLTRLYPQCPMVPTETREEWRDALHTAHRNCGWPVQLGQVTWKTAIRALAFVQDDLYTLPIWHHVLALLHVLKHVRLSPESDRLVVTFLGAAFAFDWPKGANVLVSKHLGPLASALRLPTDGPKRQVHPLAKATRQVLTSLTTNGYLRQRSLAELPGLVLHGPWSAVTPDPTTMNNFVQHGSRLTGVWVAQDGRVETTEGTNSDIVGYAWNHDDAGAQQDARARLERILPRRYEPGLASDLFRAAFPNLIMPDGVDPDAVHALFDAPIVATLLRADVPALAYEYPIVAFLPRSPSLDESTNQGKSYAALTYARILAPAISTVSSGLDSSSAPDMRDMADQLRMHGTMALDEFQIPKAKAHPLSRANLQLLCTGGRVSAGKVLENAGGVSLRHSLVLNAKALDFNPDMVNRTLPFFLGDLTDEHRANADALEAVQSGRLALLARLQTLAMVVEHDVLARLERVAKVSTSGGLRFGVHRALARVLYELRTGRPEAGEVDAAVAATRESISAHTASADDNGVLASLDEGKVLRVRLSSLLGDMTEQETAAVAAHVAFQGGVGSGGWGEVASLLGGRAVVAGQGGKPLCEMVNAVLGLRTRLSNRAVILAVEREIRAAIEPGARARIGGGPWHLLRQDTDAGMRVKLEKP